MIDLHSHILPGLDDGARDVEVSIQMARQWIADGVTVVACTPHILPGLYQNSGPAIRDAVARLQQTLDAEGIPLRLVSGADNHIVPDFVAGLSAGHLLPLADSRYVLVEPPHHVVPARIEELFFGILVAGYVPILTHPERLTWLKSRYEMVQRLARNGVWMQITAGSLTGAFGSNALYWSERMLDEGIVHIIASDAHDVERRPPALALGWEAAAKRIGAVEAGHLVLTRPQGVLTNERPSELPMPGGSIGVAGELDVEHRTAGDVERRQHAHVAHGDQPSGAGHRRRLADRLRNFFK